MGLTEDHVMEAAGVLLSHGSPHLLKYGLDMLSHSLMEASAEWLEAHKCALLQAPAGHHRGQQCTQHTALTHRPCAS